MCEVEDSTDVITVTGTTTCPQMYEREYFGWLMSAHYTNELRTKTMCVADDAVASLNLLASDATPRGKAYPMEVENNFGGVRCWCMK